MSISFNPIGSWFLVAVAALAVTILTLWAYQQRLRGTSGGWRWWALGLRLAAVLLCLLAAVRPSVVLQEKKKQTSALIFLIDGSTSMKINDEVQGQTRYGRALEALAQARKVAATLGPNIEVIAQRFDSTLHEIKPEDQSEPEGRETALGTALVEAVGRQAGKRIAAVVLLSDGSNNTGTAPLEAARRLKAQQVPVNTVGFGSENAGAGSKDIAIRDLVHGPTVFVKNQLLVKGVLVARGFANQSVDVELLVEGHDKPVATLPVKIPEGKEIVPIEGLKYIPQTAGEKKITLRVKPKEGELLRANNEVSTFITVLAGGLNALYLVGSTPTWEPKFLFRAVETSPDIQVDLKVIRQPAGQKPLLSDDEFDPGKYNVYILGDLPADYLSRTQQKLLTSAVEKGAGLIMLGGRSSFGSGGWASTELANVLPVRIHPGDRQVEPREGLKFIPSNQGLDSAIFQVGGDKADSARIWSALPPMTGSNEFGEPKLGATVLGDALAPNRVPVMIGMQTGQGRVLAFGGETWIWARASEEGRSAHRKFWRQVIFWLDHREDTGADQVKLALDGRRIGVGQKLEMTATAHDSKNVPIPDVQYEGTVERQDAAGAPPAATPTPTPAAAPTPKVEPVAFLPQRDEAKGGYYATGQPGEYKATVVARRLGKEIGRDSARFLVYQDDRETENPAADLALLRQIAEATGGASLPPEQLPKHLRSLNGKMPAEYVTQTERRVWDNWPFLLIFTTLLMLEWWLRKRHGWV
jgi:uncharacterized membrane protein